MSHWTASAVSQEESPGFYVLTFEVSPSGASRHKLKGVLGQSWLDLRNAPCSDRTYHWRLSTSAFSSGRRTLRLRLRLRVDGLKPQAQTRRWSECLCKSLGFIHFSCCMECRAAPSSDSHLLLKTCLWIFGS